MDVLRCNPGSWSCFANWPIMVDCAHEIRHLPSASISRNLSLGFQVVHAGRPRERQQASYDEPASGAGMRCATNSGRDFYAGVAEFSPDEGVRRCGG